MPMKNYQVIAFGVLCTVLGLGLGITIYPHPQSGESPYQWTQYGHNPRRRPIFLGSSQKIETWTYQMDHAGIAAPASVVNGIVYAGSNGNQVAAVSNGKQLWKVTVPNQVMTTPLVVGNHVIVGVGNKTFESSRVRGTGWSGIIALNRKNGVTLWTVQTHGAVMPTPALYRNRVYAATGAGAMVVIDWRTGQVLQKISLHGSYVSMSSPLVAGSRIYVGGATPYALYAINLTSDRVIWSVPVRAQGGLDDCSPAWADGLIVAQYTNYLNSTGTRLSATTIGITTAGKIAWQLSLGQGSTALDQMQTGQPTVFGGMVYVGSPVTDRVYAIDPRTGHLAWSTPIGAAVRGNPALLAGQLLVGDSLGRLDTLSQRTGKILRQTVLTAASRAQGSAPTPTGFGGTGPVVVGPTLYIVSMNGTILARPVRQFLVPSQNA